MAQYDTINLKSLQENALKHLTESSLTDYRICKETGISEVSIAKYRKGITRPNLANSKVLIDFFENGKGKILKTNPATVESDSSTIFYVPLLPISAQAGTLNDFMVAVKDSECERIISPIKGADWAVTISGDSMMPEYMPGTQILIKKINEKAFIDWGKVYVLDTCNGTVIKRIFPTDDPDRLKCVSINTEYPPFEVSLEHDVYGVYRVLLSMSIK